MPKKIKRRVVGTVWVRCLKFKHLDDIPVKGMKYDGQGKAVALDRNGALLLCKKCGSALEISRDDEDRFKKGGVR